jgi:hypothetical protein
VASQKTTTKDPFQELDQALGGGPLLSECPLADRIRRIVGDKFKDTPNKYSTTKGVYEAFSMDLIWITRNKEGEIKGIYWNTDLLNISGNIFNRPISDVFCASTLLNIYKTEGILGLRRLAIQGLESTTGSL